MSVFAPTNPAGPDALPHLPLLLAGPILQQTTPHAVTVWVALKQPCQVELTVYHTAEAGTRLGPEVLSGRRSTVALGLQLHVVAVTARSPDSTRLESDRLYAYDLTFTDPLTQVQQSLQAAAGVEHLPLGGLSYFPHQYPTFLLPAAQLDHLRLVHGSCRKPHGDGFDALTLLDVLIEQTASCPAQRPQQLFLTGDQIYADDVADPLLWVASALGKTLLGWDEQIPVGEGAGIERYYTPQQLPAGERTAIATQYGGFTAALHHKQEKVTSHLLSLGEYYAVYLLTWSPVCWPRSLPRGREITGDRKAQRRWDREAQAIQQFLYTLWKVRRALANIPVYSIFDDHDVSDDWNLNRAWCLRVLGRSLGRYAVQNALLAYALCQGWGNTPEQFAAGQPGAQLLTAVESWSRSQGQDAEAHQAIARFVGMPDREPQTGMPQFVLEDGLLRLHRHADALTWHYTVTGPCHQVIVLDTRTWRGYPVAEQAIAPPMLLCPRAVQAQLSHPLKETSHPDWPITFVIAPTNVFELQALNWIHHWELQRNQVFSTDVGDAWTVNSEALALFLTTLFAQRQRVVILSGDIHYGAAVRLSYRPMSHTEAPNVLVQLVSSPFKNEELLTRLIHTRLKHLLLPEPVRRWLGWSTPPDMVERSGQPLKGDRPQPAPPEWICALDWLPRHPAQPSPYGSSVPWLMSPRQWARHHPPAWIRPFLVWRSRWVQDGREVVGLNNLGLVQVEGETRDRPPTVIQDLYWFSTWYPIQSVYSRYRCPLVPNGPLLKQSARQAQPRSRVGTSLPIRIRHPSR